MMIQEKEEGFTGNSGSEAAENRAQNMSEIESGPILPQIAGIISQDSTRGKPVWNPGIFVEGTPVSLGTRKLVVKGRIGTLLFPEAQVISSFWTLIGLGKTNCIGGGQFETDHTI